MNNYLHQLLGFGLPRTFANVTGIGQIGAMATYIRKGRGESIRSLEAKENYRMPKSVWAKFLGISPKKVTEIMEDTGEWHHTGMYANRTSFLKIPGADYDGTWQLTDREAFVSFAKKALKIKSDKLKKIVQDIIFDTQNSTINEKDGVYRTSRGRFGYSPNTVKKFGTATPDKTIRDGNKFLEASYETHRVTKTKNDKYDNDFSALINKNLKNAYVEFREQIKEHGEIVFDNWFPYQYTGKGYWRNDAVWRTKSINRMLPTDKKIWLAGKLGIPYRVSHSGIVFFTSPNQ